MTYCYLFKRNASCVSYNLKIVKRRFMQLTCRLFLNLCWWLFVAVDTHINGQIKDAPNVRTVLFTKHDLTRSCWSLEDAGLLVNRYVFNTLLPTSVPNDPRKLHDYIAECFHVLREEVKSSKARRILKLAMADAFGGYLHTFALPVANRLVYEGNADVNSTNKLHSLLSEIIWTLNTNGVGWASPVSVKQVQTVQPLVLSKSDSINYCTKHGCCDRLINQQPINQCMNTQNRSAPGKIMQRNLTTPQFPLPFLDDNNNPHSIALPFKDHSLYSLNRENALPFISVYYKTVIYCFDELFEQVKDPNLRKHSIDLFNSKVYLWLQKTVLPLLRCDHSYYPGFYEVMRVIKSTEKSAESCAHEQKDFEAPVNKTISTEAPDFPKTSLKEPVLGLIAFIGLLLFIVLCKLCMTSSVKCEEEQPCVEDNDVLNECLCENEPDRSPPRTPRTSMANADQQIDCPNNIDDTQINTDQNTEPFTNTTGMPQSTRKTELPDASSSSTRDQPTYYMQIERLKEHQKEAEPINNYKPKERACMKEEYILDYDSSMTYASSKSSDMTTFLHPPRNLESELPREHRWDNIRPSATKLKSTRKHRRIDH